MKNLKILFINPCLRKNSPVKILPVGLAYVMTFVQDRGYEFDLLDIDINDYDDSYVENFIKENKYDVYAYGSIVTHYKWIKWLTRTIKTYHPNSITIIGNSVAASCYEAFLQNAPVDVIVKGEGEISCFEVLEAITEGRDFANIEGIIYRERDGKITINPPRKAVTKIDDLPIVRWDFFEIDKYIDRSENISYGAYGLEGKRKTFPVATARGCVFKCSFCHYVFWDDPYRHRSSESILTEIKRNIECYGANFFSFWDDLSFSNINQVLNLTDAIIESGLKFHWDATVRADLLGNPKIPRERRLMAAIRMKEAGCVAVGFSLESGDAEILKMMNKKIEAEYFSEQVQILREVGIAANTSVIFGYPLETSETIKNTFDMCLKTKVYPSIGFLLPLPSTGMFKYAVENGFITDVDAYLEGITERQDICLNMTKLTDDEIMEEIKVGAKELNRILELGLNEEKLVRTGGYAKHTGKKSNEKKKPPLDPDNIKRNENDFSFNYSETIFVKNQENSDIYKK